jgi:predicted DsbA family dithiol-disulfide isomerase
VETHDTGTPATGARIATTAQPDAPVAYAPRIDGPDAAPVVIVHADLSCPDCALALHRLSQIEIRVDLRHFVLRARGEPPLRAAHAIEAADLQGAFWPFARGLLADQGRHDLPHLWALAESLGLDVDRFEADRRAETAGPRIAQETREAMMGGATGVPALFADHTTADYLARSGYDAEVRIRRQK